MEYNSRSNRGSNFKIGQVRGRFELTSTITPSIVRQSPITNRNYSKIREEYDSGINYLTGLYIQLLSCPISAQIRATDGQSDSRILI